MGLIKPVDEQGNSMVTQCVYFLLRIDITDTVPASSYNTDHVTGQYEHIAAFWAILPENVARLRVHEEILQHSTNTQAWWKKSYESQIFQVVGEMGFNFQEVCNSDVL